MPLSEHQMLQQLAREALVAARMWPRSLEEGYV